MVLGENVCSMKKSNALAMFNLHILHGQVNTENLVSKNKIKKEIRKLADNDEGFENTVFELGCSILAKSYCKLNGLNSKSNYSDV